MATLQMATTRHHHSTLNNSVDYLPNTYHRRGWEGMGAKKKKKTAKRTAQLQLSNSKTQVTFGQALPQRQLHASVTECPC